MTDVPVREGSVAFGAQRTWFRIVGELTPRPPLICVHGGPGSTHHYFAPLEQLAERGRGVILYDQVGCGGSSRPRASDLSLRLFIDELANLRERLAIERAHLLGTSWGGMLAIEYALTRPAGLLGLVLSSTLASSRSWADEARRLRDEMPGAARRALVEGVPGDRDYERAERAFFDRHVCRRGVTPEIERMLEGGGRYGYEELWGPNEWTMTGTLAGWDVRGRLAELQVPVLITAGRHDLCTPAIIRELRDGLPHARTATFERSSHMPFLEEPDTYREVLSGFLDEVDADL
ncbi:MAG: proline iminopeptidase-family hydrolase [Solirubrobacterales bacterium]|nr:proline iminopeptidase-family hydrolase [Solirubrobacterales bacterium]